VVCRNTHSCGGIDRGVCITPYALIMDECDMAANQHKQDRFGVRESFC
jgi:hypothetical protein